MTMADKLSEDSFHSSSDPEAHPFLEREKILEHLDASRTRNIKPQRQGITFRRALIFHTIIFIIYSVLFVVISRRGYEGCPSCGCEAPWSPASEAIEWEDRRLEAFVDNSVYVGEPSPELDAAWSELMLGINIKIRPDEMSQVDTSSVALRDGSGFVGSLSVYHELHCVKMIRHWIYRDHYFANISDAQRINKRTHVEHCLEELRVSIACHGDTSVVPYYWLHDDDPAKTILGITLRDEAPKHHCVNWNRLHEWALSRRVDIGNLDIFTPENE